MTAKQTEATTGPQGIIAALQQKLDAALSEKAALAEALATRNSEFGERIEQQSATIDVLKVMSASPGDPLPVFDLIVRRAQELCNSKAAGIYEYDGELVHLRAHYGDRDIAGHATYFAAFPMMPIRGSIPCRAILDKQVVHIPDTGAEPELLPIVRDLGIRSVLAIPLLRDGAAIGAFTINSIELGGFSDSQVALSQTFAEQAVIAITSAETFRALQTRTGDLQETLEYQTATSDVLKVISRSTFDLQPVLDALVETAARLCNADQAVLARSDGKVAWLASNFGFPTEYEAYVRSFGIFPVNEHSPLVAFRALCGRHVVHIHDVAAVPSYPDHPIRLGKQRTSLGVPLLREGEPAGVIVLARQRVEPFTDRQIELVSTFAAQAVIAIENTRLLTEQREALEQQTATAEVLQVINASPGNLTPVFDSMLEKAMRLCGGTMGGIFTFDGDHSVTSAVRGVTAAFQEYNDKYPMDKIQPGTVPARIIETRGPVQNPDLTAGENYRAGHPYARALVELGGIRAVLAVPLLKDGVAVGMVAIYRQEAGAYSDKEIALLENFAAQAVIAMENARLITEQREALEQQTATAEVLQVINASPGNLAPVFDAMLEKAMHLCGAVFGSLTAWDGQYANVLAMRGFPPALADYLAASGPRAANPPVIAQLAETKRPQQIADVMVGEGYRKGYAISRAVADLGGARTILHVPLCKDEAMLGYISVYRQEVRVFSDKQIALVENFAAQAVIAMENARLITEQREALEQQTATAEVLQVINASPGDLTPVFDAMLDRARKLCGADVGTFWYRDGPSFRVVASSAQGDTGRTVIPAPGTSLDRIAHGADVVQIDDVTKEEGYRTGVWRERTQRVGTRSALAVPLRKDDELVGAITTGRREVRRFTENQIGLLQNFAAQAVIAMENVRLLDEIRQRQAELRVTFDNMGDGVVMFDAEHRLAASNRNFQELLDIPDAALAKRPSYADYLRLLAERGEFGVEDIEADLARRLGDTDRELRLERTRPDGRVIELRRNPVPDGGFVLIYSDITERKRSEEEIRATRDAAETALRELRTAQANLIQAEKMASLGQLTAGIAHEIKNPLNFVNNFAELSVDLLGELKDAIAPAEPALTEKQRAEVEGVSAMLTSNLEKIAEHGKRADGIVKAMLEHSRGSSGERRMVDLNALIDEALNLAYHGARAQDQSFNITLERDFGAGIAPIETNPQDMTRVFLNLFANGFYAVTRRAREGRDAGFVPTLKVTTRDAGEAVEILVRDNGTGIPADIRDKLFQPFFTTKPTGEGTGLGLSITYDIVTQQHGGSIAVDSKIGEYSEFVIRLPRSP